MQIWFQKNLSQCFVDNPIVSTGQPEYYPERGTDTILACSAKNATFLYWQRFYPSQSRESINPAGYAKYSGGTMYNPSLTVHTVTYYDDGGYLCIGVLEVKLKTTAFC
jgi:hypothetical protein